MNFSARSLVSAGIVLMDPSFCVSRRMRPRAASAERLFNPEQQRALEGVTHQRQEPLPKKANYPPPPPASPEGCPILYR